MLINKTNYKNTMLFKYNQYNLPKKHTKKKEEKEI